MRGGRSHLAALGVYFLLSIVLTYPLITRFASHVPGEDLWAFDEYTFVWNLWWFKHALLQLQQSPLFSDRIFYPVGVDLALFTLAPLNSALAMPLLAWLPLPLVSNLVVVFSFAMSSYGAHLLAWHVLQQRGGLGQRELLWSSLSAGLVYGFSSSRFVYAAIGHYMLVSTEWVPFFALYFVRAISDTKRRDAFIAGLFLSLMLYVELSLSVFAAVFAVVYLLAAKPWRLGARRMLSQLAVLGSVAALLFVPILVPALRELLSSGYALRGWGDAQKLSVDLAGFLSPSALSPWSGLKWNDELVGVLQGKGRFADINTVFVGYATLALAVAGWMSNRRNAAPWAATSLVAAVLALGPLLEINGVSTFDLDGIKVNFPLPFILFHYLPLVQANRAPNRFSVVLMLSLAVLVGYGVHSLSVRLSGTATREARAHARKVVTHALLAMVASLLVIEHLAVPLPLTDAAIPTFYARLGQDADDYTVLQLPLGWRNSFGTLGAEDTRAQYYQSAHHKRILAGNTSRNPPFKFDYFASMPIVSSLIAIETYKAISADQLSADKAFADEFIRYFDLRYVVVNPPVAGRHPYDDTRDADLQYLLAVLPLEPIGDAGSVVAYRVRPPAPISVLGIDFGEPSSRLYRGPGWDREEEISGARANWANNRVSEVLLPVSSDGNYHLTFRALPFVYAGGPRQTVSLLVNQVTHLAPLVLNPGWDSYEMEIPSTALHRGVNVLDLEFAYTRAPREVVPGSDDSRTLAVAVDWIQWEAR
jgi:hypothetical protein